ncbi:type IV toxin-antitoxin system AbiEi family antitoxin [Cellulomonas sp. WB94]|uniref:type IV toxin-antitoxin system AbiEi family antitoxin domain-containing protein n=1 Tax=Cellulomonas sp. WB94 TaxID=2173174 RepID=UPI001304C4CB|nr:type IV toxin-antitoxin system AbiEi family antitoxin [Cellulomonas sp. WB94]
MAAQTSADGPSLRPPACDETSHLAMYFVVGLTNLHMMNREREVLRLIARAPMRTVRAVNLAGVYSHPGPQLAILERRGVVHRLAHGIYCAVPPEYVGDAWRPTIEAATAAIATALVGDRVPVLTGLTAARMHRALPRAIGTGYVAVPAQRRPLLLADRDGEVRFVMRDGAALDAVAMTTDLGQVLVTTREQTLLDLARADPRAEDLDTQEAIDALWPWSDPAALEKISAHQRMRATYERVAANR